MSLFVVDVEADGPAPGLFSMVSLGIVRVDAGLDKTFYAEVRPVSDVWLPEALEVSGFTREEHLGFRDPAEVMAELESWLLASSKGRPVFVSDNLAFDWQWLNWYFWKYLNRNPFGFSGRRIGDMYAGLQKDLSAANKWKHLRKTKHTHHPVEDAKGNAEALLAFKAMGLKGY